MKRHYLLLFIILLISLFLLISGKITGFLTSTGIDTCQDSDLGDNIYQKGELTGTYYSPFSLEPKQFSEADFCQDNNILVEHSCIADGINFRKSDTRYKCSQGCLEGSCQGTASELSSNFYFSTIAVLILIIIAFLIVRNKPFKTKDKSKAKKRKE